MRKTSIRLLLLLFVSVNTGSYAQIPTSGLVAYYPFNGNANDESGNGNNGTISGATLTTDRFGNSGKAIATGSSKYVQLPSNLMNGFSSGTLSVFFKSNGLPSPDAALFDKTITGSINYYQLRLGTDGKIMAFLNLTYGESPVPYLSTVSSVSPNIWNHVVFTWDGTIWKFFVNGVLNGTFNSSKAIPNISSPIYLARTDGGSNIFDGSMDDIRIYNSALSESEISALYNEGGWPQTAPVLDIDGNTYDTVKIGTQTWMKQNLKTTKYNDGTGIPNITDDNIWNSLSTPAYAWYNNDAASFRNLYGALYNYYAVITGKLCPASWHVPTDDEWTALINYLGGEGSAGGKLKETGIVHWASPNQGATNETGFTAIPGGHRMNPGVFATNGYHNALWSSTNTWGRVINYDNIVVNRFTYSENSGFSIRCLKNDLTNGLVAYYPFNGNANDESGNGNNGTNNGATLTADRFGNTNKAYSFNGVNDYISYGALHPVYTNFSLSLWINPSRLINEPDGILGDACSQQGLIVQQYNELLTFATQGGGSLVSTTLTTQDLNKWAYYTFVMDQSAATLYKNGIIVGTGMQGSTPPTGAANFEMGRDMCQSSLYWKGSLDDIRMYNRALSVSEINSLYTEGGWAPPPTITSFTPTSGPIGSTVTITGTNFNTTPAHNIVWFGAVKATVTAAASTQLSVTVPAGAGYGPITVTDTTIHLSAASMKYFTPTFSGSRWIVKNSFQNKLNLSVNSLRCYNLTSGDIDGDGKADIVVSDSSLAVYRNTSANGVISFGTRYTIPNSAGSTATYDPGTGRAELADIDGDGRLDIVAVNMDDRTVSVYRNTSTAGSVSFAPYVAFSTAQYPAQVSVGDFNMDGKPDFAVSCSYGNVVQVFMNTSNGSTISFTKSNEFASTFSSGVIIGDIDNDGKPDLSVINSLAESITVYGNISTTSQILFSSGVSVSLGTRNTSPYLIDINQDGYLDWALPGYSIGKVIAIQNKSTSGNIVMGSPIAFETPAYPDNPYKLAIADYDGDGKPDIAINSSIYNQFSVFRNIAGTGTVTTSSLAKKVDIPNSTPTLGITTSDFDGDGRPDIAITYPNTRNVSVYQNIDIKDTSVVAYYPFNGNANDESGNGNNGTVSGATLSTDRFGNTNNAYSFDGVNDYIEVGSLVSSLASNQTGTISLWFNASTPNQQYSPILYFNPACITLGESASNLANESIYFENSLIQAAYLNGNSFYFDYKWHHVVVVASSNQNAIYVDGVKMPLTYGRGNENTGNAFWQGITRFLIGATLTSGNYYYKGSIDDIRIYNRALSASEIDSLYHENGYAQVTDIDGNVYSTVTIGTQTWIQENLKVTHYQNGDIIPNVVDNTTWNSINTGAYCNYNNDIATADTYGKLYNFFAAIDSRNLCPSGWHVPTDVEWTTLETYLGGHSVAGDKLKEVGTVHWIGPNTGTNSSNFTALPGGNRSNSSIYLSLGYDADWWTSTPNTSITNRAWLIAFGYDYTGVVIGHDQKVTGLSIRCLKDDINFVPIAGSASSILQTSFTANWSASSGATGYVLDVASDNGFTSFIPGFKNKNASNVTTYYVTGLTANTSYYYRLRAYSSTDTSSYSNVISVTTLVNPPSAPAVSSATSITQTGFTANWNSTSTATGYCLDVATDNTFSSLVSGYNSKDVSNVTTYNVTGLAANTTYYYRIRAYNAGGSSPSSNIITTQTLPNAPPAPVASSASSILQTSFVANWSASAGAAGYYLDVSTDNTFASFFNGYNNKDISNVISYSATGLTPNTTYYYRLRAYNTGGTSSNSNTITVTTLAVSGLTAPVATGATSITQTSLIANWNAVGAATGYYLDVATDNSFISIVTGYNNKDVLNVTTYTVTGLSPNTTYYYRVSAYNGGGTSANSNIISSITLTIPAPSAPVASSSSGIQQTYFYANWNSSSTATGYKLDVAFDNTFTSFVTGYNNKDVLNVTTYIVTGLSANTTYYLRVRAYNTGGTSSSSNIITTSTLIDPPVPPTALSASLLLQTTFSASWNSSATASGYYLDIAADIGFTSFITGFNNKDVANNTSIGVTGLSANTTYYYRVRAYNAGGTSSSSNSIITATLPYLPLAPTATSATSVGQNSFTANWNSSSSSTGYYLDVATDNTFSTFVTGYNNRDVLNITNYSVTGLTDNIAYYYRIRAYNTGGTSSSSNVITTTTLPDIPAPPVANSASTVSQTSLSANWTASSSATGYYLDISTDNTFASYITGYNNKDVSNVTSFSVTGLSANTTYYFRVRAYNIGGSSASSNTVNATTLASTPAAPTASAATSITQTSFKANWSSSATSTSYKLDVSTDNFATFLTGYNNLDVTNVIIYNITGLTAKTTYQYRVRAYNTGGSSASSNTITVTTLPNPPATPSGLSAKSCNNNVTLTWNANTESGFTRYRIFGGTTANPTTLVDSTSTGVISETSKTINNLSNSQTYYFKISAVISPGVESGLSNQVSVKVKTGVIPGISTKWKGIIIFCKNKGDSIKSYQWYKDGTVIANSNNQVYLSKGIAGVYKVITTDNDGCVNTSASISITATKSYTIYPNPASTSFVVTVVNESYGKALIRILNASGVKVAEYETEKLTDEFIKEIPVSNLPDGIYFVHIRINDEETIVTRLVVLKK